MAADWENVLNIAQSLVRDASKSGLITPELIAEKVDVAVSLKAEWKPLRAELITELETRFSIWIGNESFLSGDDDHEAWLNAERKIGWRYWPRYKQWIGAEWSPVAVEALDRSTDRVVGLLEDPKRAAAWDRRGLVVGHVQSGKTANYTGVICKAADAGYKLVVVLAGMHKNLRSQTQMRLDEGFLGYETMPVTKADGVSLRIIGVGNVDKDQSIRPNYVTHGGDDGDFKLAAAKNIGITPDTRPWLFVIKKNKSVLKNLIGWAMNQLAHRQDPVSGRRIVPSLPLLVIDDEADHASVDTGEQEFDENGEPNLEHEPKAINRLIRSLLYLFERSSYVGYTATPFANIFIHERGKTAEHGEDLFPRSFIVNLPAPSNYAGPARVFGLDADSDGATLIERMPLVRHVSDHAASLRTDETVGWMPPKHKNGHVPLCDGRDELPTSLQDAVLSFLLSCGARRARGQVAKHNSMLVHVTRYTSVQRQVRRQVEDFLHDVTQRLNRGTADVDIKARLRKLWMDDYVPTSAKVTSLENNTGPPLPDWSAVLNVLPLVGSDIEVREINGSAKDILDYETHKHTGFNVIAIGGDKLARGLTLEGLTVSYFLRASKMYDTLMQMGRWFGYRPGYLDVTRLYTTRELDQWFEHITEASDELREEFDHMATVGGTPRDYGLKVKSHPVLMVTSRVKMRSSAELLLSFEGKIPETVVFHKEHAIHAANAKAASTLVAALVAPIRDPERERQSASGAHRWKGSILWENVANEQIASFLRLYQTHPSALKVNSQMLAEFVEGKATNGELTNWTVALLSGQGKEHCTIGGQRVQTIERGPKQVEPDRYVIRRLLAPRDEAIDLDAQQYAAALSQTIATWRNGDTRTRRKNNPTEPSGPSIRHIRGLGNPSSGIVGDPRRALLLLYPLSAEAAQITSPDGVIVGFGISFPASEHANPVTYRVNNTYWAQEFGADA